MQWNVTFVEKFTKRFPQDKNYQKVRYHWHSTAKHTGLHLVFVI